ncbi:MAG: hypothetical protein IJV16_02935, partial [Lachnospiraceae bacterium]|nr:hypothetical protein [Lachnospiraceae bacterium]
MITFRIDVYKKAILIFFVTLAIISIMSCVVHNIRSARQYEFDFTLFERNGFLLQDGRLVFPSADNTHLSTPRFCLRQGISEFNFKYQSDTDYQVWIHLDNDVMGSITLPAGQEQVSQMFTLEWPTDRAYMAFEAPDEGSVTIDSVTITSNRMLYTDGIFQMIALLLIYILLVWIILKFETFSNKRRAEVIVIAIMILMVNLPLYINVDFDDGVLDSVYAPLAGMIRFGTDTGAQLMRLLGVMYGFLDGQFPVMLAPNYLRENGELQFLYPNIFLYPFAILRLTGASMPLVFRWF